jgi:hypothetical protein
MAALMRRQDLEDVLDDLGGILDISGAKRLKKIFLLGQPHAFFGPEVESEKTPALDRTVEALEVFDEFPDKVIRSFPGGQVLGSSPAVFQADQHEGARHGSTGFSKVGHPAAKGL